jgi:hypothetical protein
MTFAHVVKSIIPNMRQFFGAPWTFKIAASRACGKPKRQAALCAIPPRENHGDSVKFKQEHKGCLQCRDGQMLMRGFLTMRSSSL